MSDDMTIESSDNDPSIDWGMRMSDRSETTIWCRSCAYYTHPGEGGSEGNGNIRVENGHCHRYAPKPLGGGSGTGWSAWEWPSVRPNDFCGEWKDGGTP
jgi:hypothetical protein